MIVLLIVIFVPVSKIFPPFLSVVFALIPLVILIVCFAKFIFEVSGNLLNGSLLYFFLTLILCYFGGCFYPVSTFPEFFQNIHNITLLKKCGCDVTSAAKSMQVAKFTKYAGSFSVISVV